MKEKRNVQETIHTYYKINFYNCHICCRFGIGNFCLEICMVSYVQLAGSEFSGNLDHKLDRPRFNHVFTDMESPCMYLQLAFSTLDREVRK